MLILYAVVLVDDKFFCLESWRVTTAAVSHKIKLVLFTPFYMHLIFELK